MSKRSLPAFHDDARLFRDALSFTESERGFAAGLIEKDYFCSVLLGDFLPLFDLGLTFKGGTSLSKVHTDFYRLSEDLDFVFHVEIGNTPSQRRRLIEPVKQRVKTLPERLPAFRIEEPLTGHNGSTQYIGTMTYNSCVTGEQGTIKIEIGLREPIVQPRERQTAHTMLINPLRGEPAFAPCPVQTLSILETYAEKTRAALSRREPAIRDFFDLDYAMRTGVLALDNPALVELAAQKLRVSGLDTIDVTEERLAELRQQLTPRLRPVLRESDFQAFDLDRTFDSIRKLHARLEF
jgi:predicted nucleotidyltransferase component of viral defense system